MPIKTTAPRNTEWGQCPNENYKWRDTCVTKTNIATITKAQNTGEPVVQNPRTGKFLLLSDYRDRSPERVISYGTISNLQTAQEYLEELQRRNHKLRTFRELKKLKQSSS